MKVDIVRKLQQGLIAKRPSARRAGDSARDRQNWPVAEREYDIHLKQHPGDHAIWVQYGHSLKEQGKRNEAEMAYRQAIWLHPQNADAHLQLGHVLKLLGRLEEAQREYARSMDLNSSEAANVELKLLDTMQLQRVSTKGLSEDGEETTYLEIDDLLDYLRSHKTVSGIQRVQVGVVAYAISEMKDGRGSYCLVRAAKHGSGFLNLPIEDIAKILDAIKQPFLSQSRLVELIKAAEQRSTLIEPRKGNTYFILGAFWGFGSNTTRYSALKQKGVGIGVYIYDLIPVTHPEYCHAGTVSEFSFALGDGFHVFDFIITISDYVSNSVKDFVARNGLRAIPVETVPLAHRIHDAPFSTSPNTGKDLWQGTIASLKDRKYVLVVCTIEPRKNHVYLYAVWKALIKDGYDPPDLVFVGRFGWRMADFREMLTDTGFLGGRIHVMHDLSDVDLELLYNSCLFTAFPSIVEGWGLPVGESLAHGRPIIASNTSSIPEVGGDFVDYIDPSNLTDGIAVFKRMMFDHEYREMRANHISKNFEPRTWKDVSKNLLDHVHVLRQSGVATYMPPLLKPAELLIPSDVAPGRRTPDNYAQRPLRLTMAKDWYQPEAIGVWMRERCGVLQFRTDCAPTTSITVYAKLMGAPWSTGHTLTLHVGKESLISALPRPLAFPSSARSQDNAPTSIAIRNEFFCQASGKVDVDGSVTVTFEVGGPDVYEHPNRNPDDSRIFYLGLVKFTYAPTEDAALRQDILENYTHERR